MAHVTAASPLVNFKHWLIEGLLLLVVDCIHSQLIFVLNGCCLIS